MRNPFVTHAVIKNFKSIGDCDVELGSLMFLVGPNGSGKSNFLDALRFVTDALRTSLDHALRDRGGIKEVRRRSGGHPTHFSIRLSLALDESVKGVYSFRIGAQPEGRFLVQEEECVLENANGSQGPYFRVRGTKVQSSVESTAPAAVGDRLYLVAASGLSQFRPVFDGLHRMGFYNLRPESIRDLQSPDAGDLLRRDGGNIASVLGRLGKYDRPAKRRIEEYLGQVVPGVRGVEPKVVGPKETLEFRQEVKGSKDPWRFMASNMSDGTLRALGILVALFQTGNGAGNSGVPLVGIEEPEVALHPAAAGILLDSLRDASKLRQILVTSHSPDLLDDEDIPPETILAVTSEAGASVIGPPDEAGRSALRDRLYTAGDLLRTNQLHPEIEPSPPRARKKGTTGALFEDHNRGG